MATQDDFASGKGLQQTGDFFSRGLLQSRSCSLCLEDVCLQQQCWCPGTLLGSGRQSVYKSCIQSADHETLAMLASAAAILHAVQEEQDEKFFEAGHVYVGFGCLCSKYCAPVTVYCRSIPKFKPRYTALRGGSIDSNLQLCGSRWTTEEETSLQSILTTQLKKQPGLWDGGRVGKPPYARAISPLGGWVNMATVHNLSTADGEREVSSAAQETTEIKKQLKMRRMSEGLLALQRAKAGACPLSCRKKANSLPAIGLDVLEWGDEAECGDAQEARPFPNPQQGLLNVLTWLSSDDWQQKAKALFSIRRLAICHSRVLLCRLCDVSLAVCKEVNNLRSKVSHFAICTLGELFRTMQKHMDHEVDEAAQVLLQKMGDTSEFIQKAAIRSLGIMVGSVTPARAMTALMASGIQHRNVLVRKCAAEHLLTAMKQIGANKLLLGTRDSTELLVRKLVKLAQDCHQDTRRYGREMLKILMSHRKFDKYLKQSVPSRDPEDVMAKIKQEGIDDHKCEPPSAKDHRKPRNSGLTMPQDNLTTEGGLRSGSDVHVLPHQRVRRASFRTAEETEWLKELIRLLTAKDFQTMEGVVFLLDHCKSSPHLISTNIVQIFDIFVQRLQDCNKKVNQQALEALALMTPILRDALHPVLVSLVAAVTDNLNSNHAGIYAAAVKVLEVSIAHLDNALLLQAFAHRMRLLSGQALLDVTEHLSVLVASVYLLKPAIQLYAPPVLWFFLGNKALPVRSGNVRAVVTKLYQLMGSSLKEHAASQPQHVVKNRWEVLDLNVG
ncbi:LOW QUALITY PROTEIN: TOG array regulator of axonemal microtubules protein 2 [Morus bassanus]